MKQLLKSYLPVFRFIATFLGVYYGLSIGYSYYLEAFEGSRYFPDYFTYQISYQVNYLLDVLGYSASVAPMATEPSMLLHLFNTPVARIAEGCNGISVIIMFLSFVLAFYGNLKKTFLFVVGGGLVLYVANIIRIILISIAVYHKPEYSEFLHSVMFPAIIYSMVFLLWVIWVRWYSKN